MSTHDPHGHPCTKAVRPEPAQPMTVIPYPEP